MRTGRNGNCFDPKKVLLEIVKDNQHRTSDRGHHQLKVTLNGFEACGKGLPLVGTTADRREDLLPLENPVSTPCITGYCHKKSDLSLKMP